MLRARDDQHGDGRLDNRYQTVWLGILAHLPTRRFLSRPQFAVLHSGDETGNSAFPDCYRLPPPFPE